MAGTLHGAVRGLESLETLVIMAFVAVAIAAVTPIVVDQLSKARASAEMQVYVGFFSVLADSLESDYAMGGVQRLFQLPEVRHGSLRAYNFTYMLVEETANCFPTLTLVVPALEYRLEVLVIAPGILRGGPGHLAPLGEAMYVVESDGLSVSLRPRVLYHNGTGEKFLYVTNGSVMLAPGYTFTALQYEVGDLVFLGPYTCGGARAVLLDQDGDRLDEVYLGDGKVYIIVSPVVLYVR